jgi:hypothetical protein
MSDHFANLMLQKHPNWTPFVQQLSAPSFCSRSAELIADVVSGKIKMRGVGHSNDVVADNGNKTKLPQ